MFKFLIDVLFMKHIGLGRTLRNLFLLMALGLVAAGSIYLSIVLKAVQERSHPPNVHTHSAH